MRRGETGRHGASRSSLGLVAATAALVLLAAAPASAARSFGSLTQLSGPFGCTSSELGEGCAGGAALRGAASAAVSPDGRNVYVAANNSGSVVVFRRNRRSGVIDHRGCHSAGAADGCLPVRGMHGAFAVAVSPDGRHVYLATFRGLAVFAREPRTGALSQLEGAKGCVNQDAAEDCAPGRGLAGAASIVVSPDGRNVYVASTSSSAVAGFVRNPATGELSQIRGPEGCISQGGTEGCVTGRGLAGAFSITLSPNGRHAYVTGQDSNAVAVLRRDEDGVLVQLRGADGCSSVGGVEGCADARGMRAPNGVAVSADGRNVYVAASGSGAVAVFERDVDGGTIDQLAGALGCTSQGGLEGCSSGRGLDGAFAVATSVDGVNAYAASASAVVSFIRDPRSGALTEPPDPDTCTSQGGRENCLTGRALREASSVTLSPDGANAYVASYVSNAVAVFARNPQDSRVRVSVRGMPRRCARRSFEARVRVRSTLPIRRVGVRLDRRSLGQRHGARRLSVRILTRRLRRGHHRLRVHAVDVGGNRGRRTVRFRRCGL